MNISNEDKQLFLKISLTTIKSIIYDELVSDDLTHQLNTCSLGTIKAGIFVTLKKHGDLRGCIGCITSEKPLKETLPYFSTQAAFNDYRFTPLTKGEFNDIEVKISILTPPKNIPSMNEIKIGKHGIIFNYKDAHSVFLPEVATEQGWDLETTLFHLAQKAGVSPSVIHLAEYQVFESISF